MSESKTPSKPAELPKTRSLFNRFSVHEIPDAEEQVRMLTEHAIESPAGRPRQAERKCPAE